MMPGIDPKMMKQAMKRMGVKQVDIDTKEVIIRCKDKEIFFFEPEVSKVEMMGQESFQIVGKYEERPISLEVEITEDDIQTVMEQASVGKSEAKKALEDAKGDIAEAILLLQK